MVTTTPGPFFWSIYYGNEAVWQVFDHRFPGNSDNNDYVIHYDGTQHNPVTPTLPPGTTATPGPPPEPYIPDGYGYNGHLGIDYSLIYEPVLAAASGEIEYAGWYNPANHRGNYGLYVRMVHTANPNYETWYGHLSTVVVKTSEHITIDPNNPNSRYRILGISGNTGHVFGSSGDCGPITNDPNSLTCGEHLHFEVRTNNTNNLVSNPYGWIGVYTNGTPIPDPWATPGVPSYNLWATRPAVTTDQYGTGDSELDEPVVSDTRMIIDNSSADFVPIGLCWATPTGNGSYNGEYRSAPTNSISTCKAKWTFVPDAFTPSGDYDVYVHMPDALNASLSAVYNIKRGPITEQAVVVQAAYPNPDHLEPWAYIGRFRSDIEYIELSSQQLLNDNSANLTLADAIRFVPAIPVTPPKQAIYTSFETDGAAGTVSFANEDILVYDTRDSSWLMYFDGSDVGLSAVNVDAFYLMSDNSILLSFDSAFLLPGIFGAIDDSDIVRFFPTSLGTVTSGTFAMYRNAMSLGLNPADPNQDVDVISFTPGNNLLISTIGSFGSFVVFEDADLLLVSGNPGTLSLYFEGSDVGLTTTTEGVDGADNKIYLSTKGVFSVTGSNGDGADIFTCTPGSTGANTICTFGSGSGIGLYWNGSAHGFGMQNVDGFFNGNTIGVVTCSSPPNCSFEQLSGQGFTNWTITEYPPDSDCGSSTDSHYGYYSAECEIQYNVGASASLQSSSIPVTPNTLYRIRFYSKFSEGFMGQVLLNSYWTSGGSSTVIEYSTTWHQQDMIVCLPSGATTLNVQFVIGGTNIFLQENLVTPEFGSVFIDDVSIEAQGQCPQLQSVEKN